MITDLLMFPVTGPCRMAMWVIRTIAERAEAELYDEDKIRKELADLALRYDLGELSEADYERLEEELLERLRESRKRAEALSR